MKKLFLTSAVAIDGVVHKAGSVVTVDDALATNLIYREKACEEGAEEEGTDEGENPAAPRGKKKAAE